MVPLKMIRSHMETCSNKCALSKVALCAITIAPLSGIGPHSSSLAIQFYLLGKPIHGLPTDLGLM